MTTGLWPAPRAYEPVDALVELPGSKSITSRALVLSALARSPSRLRGPLRARDTELMAAGLAALGTRVESDGADWVITPGHLAGPASIDCGLAGTVLRFLPAVAGLANGDVSFDGDDRARERPVRALLVALRVLGVDVIGERLPFHVRGTGTVPGGAVTLDASASSQLVSGILLSAARFGRGAVVHTVGKPVPSLPHVRMTAGMLRERGVEVDELEPTTWEVLPGEIDGLDVAVEPDLSNAAPFLAAALVTGGRVAVRGWPLTTSQPGDRLREILLLAGASVGREDDALVVKGTGSIDGFDVDLHDVGELTPVLASIAALATGPSRLRGIAHLRGHETDRIGALATELTRLGAEVVERSDGLDITPRKLTGTVIHTYDDHRIATAAAVIGLAVDNVEVENIGTTEKTLPAFAARWRSMLDQRS